MMTANIRNISINGQDEKMNEVKPGATGCWHHNTENTDNNYDVRACTVGEFLPSRSAKVKVGIVLYSANLQ